MEAIREIVEIKSHKLQFTLPDSFNEQKVEMILLPIMHDNISSQNITKKNLRGVLNKYANKNLIKLEDLAWKMGSRQDYTREELHERN